MGIYLNNQLRNHFLTLVLFLTFLTFHVQHFLQHSTSSEYFSRSNPFSQIGYVLRYLLGQLPSSLRAVKVDGKLNLFYNNELRSVRESRDLIDNLIRVVKPPINSLIASGTEVVLLPIPAKTLFQRHLFAEDCNAADPNYLIDELERSFPGQTVNLMRAFQAFQQMHADVELFPRTDSHWSTAGIAISAKALIEFLISHHHPFSTPTLEDVGSAEYGPSYLTSLLSLPDWVVKNLPEFQSRGKIFSVRSKYSGNAIQRIILFGTSFNDPTDAYAAPYFKRNTFYSPTRSNTPLTLADILAETTRKPVLNLARSGDGLFGSAERARTKGIRFTKGDLLIWEMPMCCLGNLTHALDKRTREIASF